MMGQDLNSNIIKTVVGTEEASSVVTLLPPANEVWGKVTFLHLTVILFTRGGLPHCMLGYTPTSPGADTPRD